MSRPFQLLVPSTIHEEMVAHGRAELPLECCGLLAGTIVPAAGADALPVGHVARRYPLVNEARSATEFLSDSRSMFEAVRDMRKLGLELLAVYHSHPTSAPIPSRKDRERNYYGAEVVHLIISFQGEEPQVRGWWLTAEEHQEARWEVVSG